MNIRRIDKPTVGTISSTGKGRGAGRVSGENFSSLLDSVAPVRGANPVFGVDPVGTATDDASPRQRRDQLDQTGELLDTLEVLEKKLLEAGDPDVRERLRRTRDQALTTLSNAPRSGEERELLHRTAVLATVELEKSNRGDYQ